MRRLGDRGALPWLAAAGTAIGAAVAMQPTLVLALLGALAAGLLALFAPAGALALCAAADALFTTALDLGPVRVAPETLLLGWILIQSFATALPDPTARARVARRVRGPAVAATAYAAVALASALRAGIDSRAADLLLHAPVWIANAVAVPLVATDRRRLRLVLTAVVVASSLVGLVTLARPDLVGSVEGGAIISEHRNPLGHLLGLGTLLATSLALRSVAAGGTLVALAAALLALSTISSHSRAAWVAGAAGLAVLLLTRLRRLAAPGKLLAPASILLVAVLLAFGTPAGRERAKGAAARFGTIFDARPISSNRYREEVARVSLRLAREHPILGAGPGRFPEAARGERRGLPTLAGGVVGTDNEYARTLGELGGVGLAVLVGLGAAGFARLRRRLRAAETREAAWAPATGLSLLVYLAVLALFEDLAHAGSFWFLIGAIHACSLPEEET